MICPELIVSMLFTEVMLPNEAVVVRGVERYGGTHTHDRPGTCIAQQLGSSTEGWLAARFSNYTGYADSFAWASDHIDSVQMYAAACSH